VAESQRRYSGNFSAEIARSSYKKKGSGHETCHSHNVPGAPRGHARASRSTTSRRRAWFLLLLGGIYTTQEPASIAQALLPLRDPEAMPRSRPSREFHQYIVARSSTRQVFVLQASSPTSDLLVACPMAPTTPRASPPSRHSQADFTRTPSETGDATWVVSGVIGAERLRSWVVCSCT